MLSCNILLLTSSLISTASSVYASKPLPFRLRFSRAVTPAQSPKTLPGNWTFQGCWSDDPGDRTLPSAGYVDYNNMTVESCIDYCSGSSTTYTDQTTPYVYAGLEYYQECYCSNTIASTAVNSSQSTCNLLCTGSSSEICGGADRLSLFWSGSVPQEPQVSPGVDDWQSLGCYNDSVAARVLGVFMPVTGQVSVETCTAACGKGGYKLAGVEYSDECYCADSFANGGSPADADTCNMVCAGAKMEICGGNNRLNVYQYNSSFVPPFATSSSSSSSSTASASDSGSTSTDTSTTTSTDTSTTTSTDSSTTTSTDSSTTTSTDSSTATSTDTSTSTSTTSTTATSTGSSASPTWTSLGCYTDDVGARTLNNRVAVDGDVTTESCTAACATAFYTLAGTEYSAECYCDNDFQNGGPATDGRCSMPCQGDGTEICGGPDGLSVYQYTGTFDVVEPGVVASVGDWTSLGCYNDSTADRVLRAGILMGATVSADTCTAACQTAGYKYAGMEYADECYCSNDIANGGSPASDGCTMTCAGNSTQICGGSNRLNVYQYNPDGTSTTSSTSTDTSTSTSTSTSDTTFATDTSTATTTDFTTTTTDSTTSTDTATDTSTSTTDTSTATATDTTTDTAATTSTTDSSTSTSTTDSSSPSATGWVSLGCYTDDVGARTLVVPIAVSGGQVNVENCQAACYDAAYPLAGAEYAQECYCGTEFSNNGAPSGDDLCNMPCVGDSSEMCGGSDRLNVYQYNGDLPTVSTTPAAGGGHDDTATGSGLSVASPLPDGWSYSGCYVDGANGRILSVDLPDNAALTVESCISECSAQNYTLAGLEYSTQCFCDNQVINGGELATDATTCNMGCSGNTTEACGGPNRISLYTSTTDVTLLPVPTFQNTSLPGSWTFKGCLAEPADGTARAFPYKNVLTTNNSATNCLTLCSTYGYPAGGMEYGEECWCGDISDVATNGASMAEDADCNMACTGDAIHLCGGGNRLSYYEWTGTALDTWHTPEVTGLYEYLIGGIVIPLVATLGVNNKVTFVEKFGTGPPNSTGAYELDVTLVNDYEHAWREMHVKTDVFCSASLVLPDKKGRQLNVGGWSLDSTYGVRLYTPDGSLGVNGTNDWEENWNELHLQRGRWYPTAMTMANGSILVVGGEDGSNGAPEPTLEILPTPAGGPTYKFLDYMNRTDPYNLYPYLYVLPSERILIIYYNEARILDPVTLDTVEVLPNLPGSVNNFLAGRTYPMEGTTVSLPQHAPYTDPLTVMTCGGSTTGAAVALDNCVSIQPEVTDAIWTIERMPSKRVISCMVALPDGTYMIMNGAQQGVAGFGLATEPNLQALLYDPSQPTHSRISVLNSTTVPRMYHSEAILLQDGRVLISGSDPEDSRFNQEYRIEVYIPPYLMKGIPHPTFRITNTDWSHGGTYIFNIGSLTGSTSEMQISLLGAVSSTHGNSMGQRTIFPAFSCAGYLCRVTAPPNAGVCPPGWYQMFILDMGVPSLSQWVRIGGDPAELGNWPEASGFTLPGV